MMANGVVCAQADGFAPLRWDAESELGTAVSAHLDSRCAISPGVRLGTQCRLIETEVDVAVFAVAFGRSDGLAP
jgi:hypothetical protein